MTSKYQKLVSTPASELIDLLNVHKTKTGVLATFGISGKDTRALKFLYQFVLDNGLDKIVKNKQRMSVTREELEGAVKQSLCYGDVLSALGKTSIGGNYHVVRRWIESHNISVDHFDSATVRARDKRSYTFDDIFCENSEYSRSLLNKAVKKYKVLQYRCVGCNNMGEWNDKPISLQVDHINGVANDNRIHNLRYLCPNCHSQTDTYCGKNLK